MQTQLMQIFQEVADKELLVGKKLWKNKKQIKIQIDHQQVVLAPYLKDYSLLKIQSSEEEAVHVAEAGLEEECQVRVVVEEINQFS